MNLGRGSGLALLLVLAWAVGRAAIPADLGEGLAYVRLKVLPADLPVAARAGGPHRRQVGGAGRKRA